MDEVSGRACALIRESALERGGTEAVLLDGLSFRSGELRRPHSRIDWDEFTIFLERCRTCLGGMEALDELGALHVGQPWPSLARSLAKGVASAAGLYTLGQWNGPANFSCTRVELEKLSNGRILQTLEVLPGFRDSPEFFYGMRGIIRATPRMLGQPDAVVEMTLTTRRARYEITPPPSRTWWARARRHISRNAWLTGALKELSFQDSMLRESEQQNRQTALALDEKSRQLDSLNELGSRLAQHLSIDELASAVTKLLEEHFKVAGLVFWAREAEGDGLEEVTRSGDTTGGPARRMDLHTAGRRVGGLWLWEGSEQPRSSDDGRLDSLASWIALAVDNARTFETLSRQTRRLEREIEIRKRTEQQLFQAQKLEALGVLAGGIAHDFNNILTAIRGYAELAAERVGADETLSRDLDEIRIAGDRGSALIAQLLLFSRRQIQELSHVDVNRVIAGIERLLRRLLGETIELEIAWGSDLPPILADPAQLEQVIVNLVVNSRDALLGGGRVAITTSCAPVGTGAVVRIVVEDEGTGMSEEIRAKAFEPFFTTKAPGRGSGLGLATVHGIVSQTGGSVDVQSELGRGTTVVVELPASEGEVERTSDVELATTSTRGSETVLLVEDDPQVLEVGRQILEGHGYQVIACSSPVEALEHCQSEVQPIDVLVADVVMPQMNGIELARRLRLLVPELRNVWMSGYARDDLRGDQDPAGIFVRKPFTSETLLLAIRRTLAIEGESGDKPDEAPA